MQTLLSARQVQEVLHIDRSTVYRMAEDGRLPAIRVGKQWRFPADEIYRVVDTAPPVLNTSPLDPKVAAAIADLAGDLLGVMVIVTDMDGHPITPIANPCGWMQQHSDDPQVLTTWPRTTTSSPASRPASSASSVPARSCARAGSWSAWCWPAG